MAVWSGVLSCAATVFHATAWAETNFVAARDSTPKKMPRFFGKEHP
jgi:hypothetical protein